MGEYLGLGTGAHSFIGGRRFACVSPGRYEEQTSATGLRGDFIFTQLRLTDGLSLPLYESMFGESFTARFAEPLSELSAEGLIEVAGDRCRLTAAGLDATNPVIERLFSALNSGTHTED
jgi:oxygen-independent coproporphyrinogen-3 oxidase